MKFCEPSRFCIYLPDGAYTSARTAEEAEAIVAQAGGGNILGPDYGFHGPNEVRP